MNITICNGLSDISAIKGLTVVIDVLRATTTACYLFSRGVKEILPVLTIEEAYEYKKLNPSCLLVGERGGVKPENFDYGNSPGELEHIQLPDDTVIFTTTSGTKGILSAKNAAEIITGSFVNAHSVVSYIRKQKPSDLTLLCTSDRFEHNEDMMCARYIKSVLDEKPLDFVKIQDHLYHHPSTDGFLTNPLTKWSKRDFELSITLDTFDFIVKADMGDLMKLTKK